MDLPMTPFGAPPAFTLHVQVEPPLALDDVTTGPVRMVRITGGTVSGAMTGVILSGGTDWQDVRADGGVGIEARYLLQLTDGTRVELQSRGARSTAAKGFWSSIWLRTTAPQWDVLNQTQYLGLGSKGPEGVEIAVFALPEL